MRKLLLKTQTKMPTRVERDSLGKRELDEEILYGIQTLRSQENYQISGETLLPEVVIAYAQIKKAAAQTNADLGKLDKNLASEIVLVCEEIISGKYSESFVVDVFQAGAGTATNMNLNEVITNKILENRGESKGRYDIVSPNDHVNMSQSTNDTYPSTMRVALVSLSDGLINACEGLIHAFEKKSEEFSDIITSGRTHLQDAVPITLGQEFAAYSLTLKKLLENYKTSVQALKVLSLGGSAIGTGINTHPEYQKTVIKYLSGSTGYDYIAHENMIEGTQSQRQIGDYMSSLKALCLEIVRITSDLKILSSGPHTGIGEINLPAVQPGSSIMPGKVNPSIIEAAHMVCYRIIGAETSVSYCLQAGKLNLNVMMPLMSYEAITSTKIFTNMCSMLSDKCISGITANKEVCEKYAHESNGIFTALNPILGYQKVADLIKQKEATGKTLKELLSDSPDISSEQIDMLLNPKKLSNI